MKSLRFHLQKAALHFFLVLYMLALGCSKSDENVTPEDPDIKPLPITSITETIGSSGGSLILDSISIQVPAGTFTDNITLDLAINNDPDAHPQPAVTGVYQLRGLPKDFRKAIRLSLKHRGNLKDNHYLAHGNEATLPLTDSTFLSYHLLDCQDSAGYLTASLLPREENIGSGGRKSNDLNNKDLQDIIDTFNGVDSHVPYHSVPAGYIINYPKTLDRTLIEQIAHTFEQVHDGFQKLGINPDNYPGYKYTKDVTIIDLRANNAQPARDFTYYWNDYEYTLGINSVTFDNSNLSQIIGTCFFGRFLNSFVYPNNDMRKMLHWNPVDIAILFWMHEKWNDSDQIDQNVLKWITSGDVKINLQIFSKYYFNFTVIKYLSTLENPENLLKKYFMAIKNNSGYLAALLHSIETPEEIWLPYYYQNLFEGNIYNLSGQLLNDTYLNNDKVTLHKNLPLFNQTDTYFDDWMDLSAYIYYFDLDNADLTEKSRLTFTITSKDIDSENLQGLLFSIDKMTKEISYLDKGVNLSIADPVRIKDEKSDIFIVIVNSQSIYLENDRSDNLSTIQLDVSLEQILPYHHMKIYLDSITVLRKYYNGSTYSAERSHNPFGEVIIYDEYKGSFSKDNKFTGGWDYIYSQENANDQHHQGTVSATLDPESLLLTNFDFEINTRMLDGNGQYKYIIEDRRHIVGANVLLQRNYNGLVGRIKGKDIRDLISLYEVSIKYGDPEQNQLIGFYAEDFELTDDSVLKVFFDYIR